MGLRDTLQEKPIVGVVIAVLAIGVGVYFATRSGSRGAPDSIERRAQTITVRDVQTGDTWEMRRADFERALMLQSGYSDETHGIPSEFSKGQPNGVLADKDDWKETYERINAMKRRAWKDND